MVKNELRQQKNYTQFIVWYKEILINFWFKKNYKK